MSTFRAMNTDVAVVVPGADEAKFSAIVAQIFATAEQRFSRFRGESELAQLNRATERIVVSAPMFEALVAARRYVELTEGVFDPGIGGSLAALGYDRSFAPGALDRDRGAEVPRQASFLDLQLDATTREVTRPAGLQIDLGGMIKGRTVDEAARCLPRVGAIDAGGDAVLRGGAWPVEIEDPRDPSHRIATVRVRDGAVATSAGNRRRWNIGGSTRHHIIDPRTQRSSETDLLQVTVFAPSAELADVLAKTVFVLGEAAGRRFLARFGSAGAILVRSTGAPIVVGTVDVVKP